MRAALLPFLRTLEMKSPLKALSAGGSTCSRFPTSFLLALLMTVGGKDGAGGRVGRLWTSARLSLDHYQ